MAGCSSSNTTSAKTITIGIDLALSGGDASVGQSTLNGMLLAIEEANAKGLPGGWKLVPQQLDDAVQGVHNPEQGVANARTFISDPSVLAMLGPYNSNVAAAQIPVTNAAGLAQVSQSTVSDELTIGDAAKSLRRQNPTANNFFRVCTTVSRQGTALAQFATRQLHLRTAYIVDDNETYGLDLANAFERDFGADGGTVLGHDHLAKNTQDFKALLTKIAAAKPALVFYGGVTSTGGGLIRKQMFDTGLGSTPFLGGDGIPDIATVAGKDADGSYYTIAAPDAAHAASARTFIASYEARFKSPVGAYSANAYAAAQVVIAAIEKALATDASTMPTRAQVLANVAATDGLQTPIGSIGFDANGDVKEPVLSLYGFKNGQPVFISQLNLTK